MSLDVPIEVARRRAASFNREQVMRMGVWDLVDAWNELHPGLPPRERKFPTLLYGRRRVLERLTQIQNGDLESNEEIPTNPPGDPHRGNFRRLTKRLPRPGSLETLEKMRQRRSKRGSFVRVLCSPRSMTVSELAEEFDWSRTAVMDSLRQLHNTYGIGSYEEEDGVVRLLVAPLQPREEGAGEGGPSTGQEGPQ